VRVLLDESLPQELATELALPYVRTVSQQGWSGLKNGALLERAQTAGFSLFLTADQRLPYQQSLEGSLLSVIVLRARSNRISDLLPLIPAIHQILPILSPGQVVRLGG
jgi:hypothetical protein